MCKKNKIIAHLLSAACLLIFTKCETEFNTDMPYREIPVIYGILDPADSEYQVSISKTFLPARSASRQLSNASELYFDTLVVALELRYDSESPTDDSPDLSQRYSYPYYYYGELLFRKEMQLKETLDPTTGTIRKLYTIDPLEFIRQGSLSSIGLYKVLMRLTVYQPQSDIYSVATTRFCQRPYIVSLGSGTSMCLYDNDVEWGWIDHGNYSEAKIICHYRELTGDTWVNKELAWTFVDIKSKTMRTENGGTTEYKAVFPFTESMFQHRGGRIKNNPAVEARKFINYDLVIFCTDPVFQEYKESVKVVSDQMGQPISNISNGLGVFVSANHGGRYGFTLDQRSLDSLVDGQYTRHLKFVRW
jgi:hypothetical protein